MESVEMPAGPPDADDLPARRAHARAWADVLRLPLRHKRWRGTSGELAGLGVGSSLDFQDHRTYLPGDDPRQINWQAYARTGQYSMKLYREEVRPFVDIALDTSGSMWAFPEKRARAAELLYFTVESARRAGATVRAFAIAGPSLWPLSEESIAGDRWAAEIGAGNTSDPPAVPLPHAPPSLGRMPFRLGSLRVLISDLLFPGAPESVLHPLVARQGRGLVLAPFANEELNPDWQGNLEFIEAEARTRHHHHVDPPTLTRYKEAYQRHFDLWKQAALRHGIAMARIPSQGDLGSALRLEAVPAGALEC
ncbi:MAG: DUF58 domain-containing protein [Verrucomicrobiales bacterium]